MCNGTCECCELVKNCYIFDKAVIGANNIQYYRKNKDKILANVKEYQLKNKDKIKSKNSEKITCLCGGVYTNQNKTNHFRTIKHKKYIEPLKSNYVVNTIESIIDTNINEVNDDKTIDNTI
jgi:hypothetical protein